MGVDKVLLEVEDKVLSAVDKDLLEVDKEVLLEVDDVLLEEEEVVIPAPTPVRPVEGVKLNTLVPLDLVLLKAHASLNHLGDHAREYQENVAKIVTERSIVARKKQCKYPMIYTITCSYHESTWYSNKTCALILVSFVL